MATKKTKTTPTSDGGGKSHGVEPASSSESFRDLVGDVEALPQGPLRHSFPVQAPEVVIVRSRETPTFVIETHDDFIVGHQKDVPARRAHELGRGVPFVHQSVDLHRLSASEASQALSDAVQRAKRDGVLCLLVVHGKGTHSGRGGPVLPDVVVGELTGRLGPHVEAFRTAPRSHGGSGALVVRLR